MEKPESAWSRGWRDTKNGLGDWRFWALEFFGGGMIGLTWGGWAALFAVASMFGCMWIGATVTAPIRQRNEERLGHDRTKRELNALRGSKHNAARRLTPSQSNSISSLIRGRVEPLDQELIVLSFQNEECMDLSSDFVSAFKNAGLRNAHVETQLISGGTNPQSHNIDIIAWASSDLELLREMSDLLTSFNMKHQLHQADRSDGTSFRIVINRPELSNAQPQGSPQEG